MTHFDSHRLKPNDSPERTFCDKDNHMPMFSRGPEVVKNTTKAYEEMKNSLEQSNINLPDKVLRRGIIMPQDLDSKVVRYAKPGETLPKNPFLDPDWLRQQARIEAVKLGISMKQHRRLVRRRSRLEAEAKK